MKLPPYEKQTAIMRRIIRGYTMRGKPSLSRAHTFPKLCEELGMEVQITGNLVEITLNTNYGGFTEYTDLLSYS